MYNYDDYLYGDEILGEDEILGYSDEELGLSIPGWARSAAGAVARGARSALPGFVQGMVGGGSRAPMVQRAPVQRFAPQGIRRITAQRAQMSPIMSAPPLMSNVPGVPQNSQLYIPLGLGSFVFTSVTPTSFPFQTNPQKPVRPRRLWIDIARSAGAGGVGAEVTDIKIGTKSMLGGASAIPAAQFAPGAFAMKYQLFDSASPGLLVTVQFSLTTAVPVGESVSVSVSFDCDSIG
jgi:hypothetical protein